MTKGKKTKYEEVLEAFKWGAAVVAALPQWLKDIEELRVKMEKGKEVIKENG